MKKPIKVSKLDKFKKETEINGLVDQYKNMLDELFQVRNPWTKMKKDYSAEFEVFKKEHLGKKSMDDAGEWFYFPWNKFLVHYLPDALHQEIRTARNKDLITKEEQEKIYNTTIAVVGLSVGSHGALIMSMMGMARRIKLADPDEISASNLNRLNYDFTKIGKNKAETVAEQIYQMNPYADIEVFPNGVKEDALSKSLSGVDILIEEMDNLPMKIMIRKQAKKNKIPVLMATDNGNSVILDIERFDMDSNYPIFHGRANFSEKAISPSARQTNPKMWNKISSEIIGIEFMEESLLKSLTKIGQTLSGVPQLGAAATISGALVAICALKIATQKPLISGKFIFSTEEILDPNYKDLATTQSRESTRANFKKIIES